MENFQSTLIYAWNLIVESNLFNFIIFIILFALIFKKFDIKGLLESARQKVINFIELSKQEKEEALSKLTKAQSSIANLENELKVIIDDAGKSAEIIKEKILTEAQKQLESIESSAEKFILAEEKQLVAKLAKTTSKASVEVAKAHISNVLNETPTLHEKYINESIDELDRLNF